MRFDHTPPTQSELADHRLLHLNYRDWCEDCVRARALAAQNRTVVEESLEGVTWNMDYCFLGASLSGDAFDDEPIEKQRGDMLILIVYDDDEDAFWSLSVGHKRARAALRDARIGLRTPATWAPQQS